jgi:SEC-C motif domain protein
MLCYCRSLKLFDMCCKPLIAGDVAATTCEQLMRSRYSAYCHRDVEYICRTYHSSVRSANPKSTIAAFANGSHFIELNVLSSEQNAEEGFVCFKIKYIQGNGLYAFSERSRFVYSDAWYYVDGVLTEAVPVKLGRNDLCPCKSGKKFKSCFTHNTSGN